jgi:dihydroorotate dehydrogenase
VLHPYLDFFVVNVSSPNTPNLRQLQDKSALDEIFAAIQQINQGSAVSKTETQKPILVKVAPDLTFEALDEILELVGPRKIAGIIATNTTISRPESSDPEVKRVYSETGGLSGRPLRSRSTEIIRHLDRQTHGKLPIIGVGGIFTAADAWEKISAGASLIQVYTGLVYEGPTAIREIVRGLMERLEQNGLNHLNQAIGLGNR